MYPASDEMMALFQQRYRQVARITLVNSEETLELTESDIVQGGLVVDRYSVSGDKIELGSAIASELTLKLKNYDGQFDSVNFEGAELFVEIGIKKWDAHRWEETEVLYMPMGYFIVDTPPRTQSTITLSALDRMVLFDQEVDWDNFTFPMTVAELIERVCKICGVTIATDLTTLVNYDYELSTPDTDESLTYRNLIQWAGFLTATCAYMDYNGELVFQWYTQTDISITPSERYSSDMYENDVVITGLTYSTSWETECEYGTSDYALEVSGCSLIQSDVDAEGLLPNIYQAIQGFTYRPYEATVKPYPYLYPLDMILYTDAKGAVHETIITHVMFTLNSSTQIKGSGETTTSSSYNLGSGLTGAESAAIEKVVNHIVQTKNSILAEVASTYETQEASAQILVDAKSYADGAVASLELTVQTVQDGMDEVVASLALVIDDDNIARLSASADRIELTAGQLIIDSGNFILDEDGNVSCTGTVDATSLIVKDKLSLYMDGIDSYMDLIGFGSAEGAAGRTYYDIFIGMETGTYFIYNDGTGEDQSCVMGDLYIYPDTIMAGTLSVTSKLTCKGDFHINGALVDSNYSTDTYTEFNDDVISSGTVIVTKKLGWCNVHGVVTMAEELSNWTQILDSIAVPAPQNGCARYITVSSWSASYVRPARIRINATGGLYINRGGAFEVNFNIVYPIE